MKFTTYTIIAVVLMISSISILFVVSEMQARMTELARADCMCTAQAESTCPHANSMPLNVYVAYTASLALIALAVFLVYKDLKRNPRTSESTAWSENLSKLEGEEKEIYSAIVDEGGVIFQSELVERGPYNKVKVSRLLDRLEARGLLERKRRGMSNVLVLKR